MNLSIALDIGGTKFAAGLVDKSGRLVDRAAVRIPVRADAEELFALITELVTQQIDRARGHHGGNPIVIGVGSAGPITRNVETVSPLNILGWRGFPLRSRLADLTGLPVFGDGDAKALALAEGWRGSARGYNSFIAMVVSTGIGGGIILNGRLLDGETGNAGHIGHVIVEPDGRRCECGARGCLEAEASGPAIEAITGRPPTQPTYEIMQRTGRLVGRGVASVINLLDIPLAVVGGSVALGFGATFFQAAQDELDALCGIEFARGARIIPAKLGDAGPLIGAGAVGWRGLRRSGIAID